MENEHLFDVGPTRVVTATVPEAPDAPKQEPVDLTVPMAFESVAGATMSEDGKYRYVLWRKLLPKGKTVLFVGLNPSTADAETDDPTVRAMLSFAKRWHCATVIVANIFAVRSTDPVAVKAGDSIGPLNEGWLLSLRSRADICVACWGNGGSVRRRGREVFALLERMGPVDCLAINRTGQPKHPLYVRRDTELRPFAYGKEVL